MISKVVNDAERVNKIIAFTGQSLKGPPDSIAFMKLADSAVDAMPGVNKDRYRRSDEPRVSGSAHA